MKSKDEIIQEMVQQTIQGMQDLSDAAIRKSKNKHYPTGKEYYEGRAAGLQEAKFQLQETLKRIEVILKLY